MATTTEKSLDISYFQRDSEGIDARIERKDRDGRPPQPSGHYRTERTALPFHSALALPSRVGAELPSGSPPPHHLNELIRDSIPVHPVSLVLIAWNPIDGFEREFFNSNWMEMPAIENAQLYSMEEDRPFHRSWWINNELEMKKKACASL